MLEICKNPRKKKRKRTRNSNARRSSFSSGPMRIGQVGSFPAHGKTLQVKLVSKGNYHLHIVGEPRVRWASTWDQVREDTAHFSETGTLPRSKGSSFYNNPKSRVRRKNSETASWVIREKSTKKVLFETYNPKIVKMLNTKKYEAVPILKYLQDLNREIKTSRNPACRVRRKNPYYVIQKESPWKPKLWTSLKGVSPRPFPRLAQARRHVRWLKKVAGPYRPAYRIHKVHRVKR